MRGGGIESCRGGTVQSSLPSIADTSPRQHKGHFHLALCLMLKSSIKLQGKKKSDCVSSLVSLSASASTIRGLAHSACRAFIISTREF